MDDLRLDVEDALLDTLDDEDVDVEASFDNDGGGEARAAAQAALESVFQECVHEAAVNNPTTSAAKTIGGSDQVTPTNKLHALLRTVPSTEAVLAELGNLGSAQQQVQELATKDKLGNLPLHVAVENNASVEVVAALLALAPSAADTKNFVGLRPIDVALACFSRQHRACLNCGEKMRKVDSTSKLTAAAGAYSSVPNECSQCDIKKLRQMLDFLEYFQCKACSLSICARCIAVKSQTRTFKDGDVVDIQSPPGFLLAVNKASIRAEDVLPEIINRYVTPVAMLIPADKVSALLSSRVHKSAPDSDSGLASDSADCSHQSLSIEFDIVNDTGRSEQVVLALLAAMPKTNGEDGKELLLKAASSASPSRVLSVILDVFPLAMAARDSHDSGPLQVALHAGAPLDSCLYLLERDQGAARHRNKRGYLPLHSAVSNNASPETVAALLTCYPESASFKSKSGRLPIQYALMSKHPSTRVVQLLLDAYPAGALEQDSDGDVMLYFAMRQQSPELVKLLLDRCPESARKKNKHGRLSLHIALMSSNSATIVNLLLGEYPEAAAEPTANQELPIHIALTTGATPECVAAILSKYPEAVHKATSAGVPASHLCTSVATLEALLCMHPDLASADKHARTGDLPLHAVLNKRAALGDAAEPMALLLLERNPAGAGVSAGLSTKHLPISLALKNQASLATIKAILQAYPDAVNQTFGTVGNDSNASLLQCAMTWGAPPEILLLLLEQSPPDSRVAKGILAQILQKSHTLRLVENILLANPDAATEADKKGCFPLHVAVQQGAGLDVITHLVERFPQAASAADEDGDLPLHLVMAANIDATSAASSGAPSRTLTDPSVETDAPALPVPGTTPYILAVATLLLKHNPTGCRAANKLGLLPLHLACRTLADHDDVFRLLLDSYPEGAAVPDQDDTLPVAYACLNHASLSVIRLLLDFNPSSAEFRSKGYNLLHFCFRAPLNTEAPAKMEVIELLLQRCPGLVGEANSLQFLPLHYAVRQGASFEITKHLLSLYPEAASHANCNDETPLHIGIQLEPLPHELLRLLLSLHPQACAAETAAGSWPFEHLFAALDKDSPPELLELLEEVLKAHPAAAGKENSSKDLPIHVVFTRAIMEDESTEAASFNMRLMDILTRHATREVLAHQGDCDYLPLHLACKVPTTPLAVVQRMCQVYPEGCLVTNNEGAGNVPLHYAVRDRAGIEVVELLLRTSPASAAVTNGKEELPLGVALKNNESSQVIMALVKAYPESIYIEMDGHLPIVYAMRQKKKELILALLLSDLPRPPAGDVYAAAGARPLLDERCDPDEAESAGRVRRFSVASCRDDDGDEVAGNDEPLLAAFAGALKSNIFASAFCSPLERGGGADFPLTNANNRTLVQEAAKSMGEEGYYSTGASWGEFIIYSSKLPPDMIVDIVKTVFDQNASLVHYLARHKDSNGREAIAVATGQLKALMLQYILFYGRFELQPGPPVHRSATATVYYATCHESSMWAGPPEPSSPDGRRASQTNAFNKTTRRPGDLDANDANDANDHLESPAKGRRFSTNFRLSLDSPRLAFSSANDLTDYASNCVSTSTSRQVALKFMRSRSQFDQETSARELHDLDPAYIVDVLECFDADADDNYFKEVERLGADLQEFRYCLVMPAGDRTLKEIIDKERIAGRDIDEVRNIAVRVARALGHLHLQGRIHGDLKPLNIMRLGVDIKLIDLDASCSLDEVAAKKYSSAYLPPELFVADPASGLLRVKREGDADPVLAHPSQDMWAFGCVLFQLFSGEALFHSNDEDNISDQETVVRLAGWTAQTKTRKLLLIKNIAARNLVSQLLSARPSFRPPTIEHVLAHSFFTGRTPGRMLGASPDFDVFISYRWFADDAVAVELHRLLSEAGLSVWLDKKQLKHGLSWEDGFCDGLIRSRCFVPVISRPGVKAQFESLDDSSACDNVLLEHRLALELHARGLVERIFPLFVGDLDAATGTHGHFFRTKCAPEPPSSAVVFAVEEKLQGHLDRQALGMPFTDHMTVQDVWVGVTKNLGGFLEGGSSSGEVGELVRARAGDIVNMVADLRRGDGLVEGSEGTAGAAGGGGALLAELLDTRQRLQNAEEEIERLAALLRAKEGE